MTEASQPPRRSVVCLLLLGVFMGNDVADAQQAAMLVLEAPASTEAMAYGNTPYLYSRESGMMFYAPALLPRSRGVTAALQRYGSAGTMATLSGAGPWHDGGLAIGLQYLRYGAPTGLPVGRDSQSVTLTTDAVGVTEFVGSIGYGREILGLRTGIVVKYLEQTLNQHGDRTVAVDLGVAAEVGPVLFGLTGRNLGPDLDVVDDPCPGCAIGAPVTRRALELPILVAGTVSSDEFQLGPLDLFFTAQVLRRRDGAFIPSGGAELSYWPVTGYTFRVRGGLERVVDDQRSAFTFGAAFTGDNITLEYAFQGFSGVGNAHRFGFRWQ